MKVALLALVCAVLAMLGTLFVRRRAPLDRLREHHEVASALFAVIGGIYGVVLAFVLVSSWSRFEEARAVVEAEGNALLDLWRHAAALPAPQGPELRVRTLGYATVVLTEEWPSMSEGQEGPQSQGAFNRIWESLLATSVGDSKQSVLFQNTLGKMDDLSDARRTRLLFARVSLPGILWAFLVFGGLTTMGFSCFFGVPRIGPQLLMTALLAATIGAALGLIAELQTPFAGAVRVQPWAIERLSALEAAQAGAVGR